MYTINIHRTNTTTKLCITIATPTFSPSTAIQSLLSAPCVVKSIRNQFLRKRVCSTLALLAPRRAAARLSISRAPGGRNLLDLDTGDVFQPANYQICQLSPRIDEEDRAPLPRSSPFRHAIGAGDRVHRLRRIFPVIGLALSRDVNAEPLSPALQVRHVQTVHAEVSRGVRALAVRLHQVIAPLAPVHFIAG